MNPDRWDPHPCCPPSPVCIPVGSLPVQALLDGAHHNQCPPSQENLSWEAWVTLLEPHLEGGRVRRVVLVARGTVSLTLYDLQYDSGQLVLVAMWPLNQTEHGTSPMDLP